jgi:cobalt-zinc-cadmium efflux system membrane fusion protein
VAAAQAARMEQLAREGIIAPARAEEARATFSAAQATMNENRRLLALGAASADGTITLRAPIAGRVTTVGIDAGSPVGSGPAPFLIENNAQLRLDLQIPERLAGHVRPGMAVHVEQDGRSATGACSRWPRRLTRPPALWPPRPACRPIPVWSLAKA